MPIYNVQAPNGKTYKVEGPENANPNTLFGFVQQQVDAENTKRLQKEYGPGVMETFGRGVKRGMGELGSTFTDIIPAMGASALGFDDYAKEQLAEAAAKRQAREAEAAPVFRSYKDVEGVGDAAKYLAESIGEQVPNIATSLIPGVGAGVAATRAGLTAAGKAAAVGAGTYLGAYAQNAPEIFQNVYENTGELAPGASAIFGAASAALDSVLPARLLKNMSAPVKAGIVEKILEKSGMDKGLLRSVTAQTLTGIPAEGLTEGAQEAISIAAENFVDKHPHVFGSKEWDRIMESTVKGAVSGGAFGGLGGAAERANAGAERRNEYADALERRGERLQAAEVRRQSAEIEAMQAQAPQVELPGFEAGPASGLYMPPAPEPAGPKEPKATQFEMFTPEGGLTPTAQKLATKDEKAAAVRARQEEQRQAAELKEAQAKLKKSLGELTNVPTDLVSLAKQPSPLSQIIGQTRGEMDTLAAKRGPLATAQPAAVAVGAPSEQTITEPTLVKKPEPLTPQTMPAVVNDEVLKGLGLGHTALIRKNKLLEGKDITNPEDAAEVKSTLEAYVENRSQPIREKIEAYLARPEFQGAPNVTGPDTTTGGGSTGVVSEPAATGNAPATEGPVGGGDISAGPDVANAPVGEGKQPRPLTERQQRIEFGKAVGAVQPYPGMLRGRINLPAQTAAINEDFPSVVNALEKSKNATVAEVARRAKDLGTKIKIDNKAEETYEGRSAFMDQMSIDSAKMHLDALNKIRELAPVIEQLPDGAPLPFELGFTRVDTYHNGEKHYAQLNLDNIVENNSSMFAKLGLPEDRKLRTKEDFKALRDAFERTTQELGENNLRLTSTASAVRHGIAGKYDADTNTIHVPEYFAKNEAVLAHEIVHAQVLHAVANPTKEQRPAVARLNKLYEHVKGIVEQRAEADKNFQKPYGVESSQEFIAEGLSNPDFQFLLSRIKYENTTVWDKFVEAVAKLLGLKNDNALTELLTVYSDLTKGAELGTTSTETKQAKTQRQEAPTKSVEDVDVLKRYDALDESQKDQLSELSGVPRADNALVGALMDNPTQFAPLIDQITTKPRELGKREKADLGKAEKGRQAATEEQAKFIEDVDSNIDALLTSKLREKAKEAGLKNKYVPAENYRGTDLHNFLRLPALFAQHRDSVENLRESQGTPQQAKNEQQIKQIEEAIAASGPDAMEMFQRLQQMPAREQGKMLSELNRMGLQEFDKQASDTVAKIKADLQTSRAAPLEKPEAVSDQEIEEAYAALSEATGKTRLGKAFQQLGSKLFLPQYTGPAFDQAQMQLAQRGDVNGLLRSLLDGIKNPEIKQVLRRIRSLNLNAKVVIGKVEDGKAGSYDSATNTITLDPQNGMNAHTFIHEVTHAAISHVLASPNHPLTKQFQQFFVQVQDRLGAAYGAQNLQEFAAELVGNPEFQAILKTIKAPRSGNMFQRIMQSIAEFFGFGKSALDVGTRFVSDAVDISNQVEASDYQKMFYGPGNFSAVGQIGQSMPNLVGQTINQAKNTFSNVKDVNLLQAGLGLLRLDNLNTLYTKELPSIQKLINALERRNGVQEQRIKNANDNYRKFVDIQKKHPQAVERMGDMAIDARLAEVDLLDPKFKPTAANQAEYSRLGQIYRSLPADVQGMYKTMRGDYDASLAQYKALLLKSVSPSLAQRLANEFQNLKGVTGYIPFLRHGDFWVEYEDPQTGERAASAFESVRERQQFIDTVLKPQKLWHKPYQNLQSIAYSAQGVVPTSFIGKVMTDLQKQGASQQQLDSVYQSYLTLFPGESILKQFMKAKNVRGMERDMVRNYGDIMVRWARKLANSEYTPEIDRALGEIAAQGENSGSLQIEEAAKTILRQSDFFHNPNYSNLVHSAAALSYFEYIAGNISSAIVNLTSLPMLVWPMLSGKFGFAEASSAMMNASRVAINGMEKSPRYKKLYDTLMEHGQLQHTMAREILEGRRQTTAQYNGLYAKILNGLSIPFAESERYNRATTAIAAYDLAKAKGMNEDAAIRYALNTTKDAHTSGLASTAPRWMQHPIGRVFFTFKSFAWNSAFVVARAFHQAYKGETPAVRKAAQRQLIGMYGMATVFAGAKGMPFYGAVSTLATMLNSLFGDDEPFDFDEEMRHFFGELLYKGAFNYATNLEISNRVGVATDLLFRDDPRGIAEHGYALSAMQQAFGPLGSYAVNAERGIKAMKEGHVERGVEALLPSWARNGLKGARYLTEGAVTMKGDAITEDVSAYNALMQVIGFAPADLSTTYEKLQAAKGYEREVNAKRTQLLNRYDMAQHAGDDDMKQETRAMIAEFNQRFPVKRITSDTLQKSITARRAAEKQMIHGVRFDKKLMPEIREEFFSDEQ